MAGEFETGEEVEPLANQTSIIPEGLKKYASDVALPFTLPIKLGAQAITGAGGLALDLARARGYLPPAADAADPDFSDVQGGSSDPVPAAPSGEPIPPPTMAAPPAAPAPVGRTRAAPPANATPPSDGPGTDAVVPPTPVAAPAAPDAAPAGPYQNPLVAKYMADRQARIDELRAAQKEAARRTDIAIGLNAMDSGFKIGTPQEAEARLKYANQPVADVEARQGAGDKALAEASKQQELEKAGEMSDPNSPLALQMVAAGVLPKGAPPSIAPQVAEYFKAKQDAALKREEEAGRNTRERETRASAEREGAANRGNAYAIAKLRENQARDEKPLPPAATKEVEDALEVAETTPDLRAKQKEVGPVTGALGRLGLHVGAEGEYNDAVKAASGTIARAEFPGARGPQGAKQVQNTLPTGIMPSDRANEQYNNIDKVAINRAETKLAALKAAHPNHPQIAELEARLAKAKQATGSASVERKSVGGRNFVKIDGKWHEE